tara:strand:- start:600 stop:1367 length:768 start_codon:yes stop_codon:yes gene_type:complete
MTKFTILGCGSSLGSPWITNYWGKLNKKNKLNLRTRCSAHISKGDLSILIDTSPDIKKQILDNNIKNIDSVLYTHEHADQTSGIFELRPFFWKNKKAINVYANKRCLNIIKDKYDYCFYGGGGYIPIIKANVLKNKFVLKKKNTQIKFKSFLIKHGHIKASAYVFEKIAYLSDCNGIDKKNYKDLQNLKYLVIDCLKINAHPSHFNLDQAINISRILNPKKTILTNLHTDLDYSFLKKNLPDNIIPAYDGITLTV